VVSRYTDSNLRFTNDDFVDFFPTSFAEPIQSTQLDHQFYGRGEVVWSPVAGFKNFFGVNYTNSWTWNFDPNMDTGLVSPAVYPRASASERGSNSIIAARCKSRQDNCL
jgi:hypothetical protein